LSEPPDSLFHEETDDPLVADRRSYFKAACGSAVAGNSLDKVRAEFGVRFLIMDLIRRRMLQRPFVFLGFMAADKTPSGRA
jgi:hypothetical protein